MIYVVEFADGSPKHLRKSAQVAAYSNRESAERAARSLGGVARAYTVGGSFDGGSEELSRDIADLRYALQHELLRHAECRVELGNFMRRNRGGELIGIESFREVAARVEREARAWRKVAEMTKRISGEESSE